ncbi:MAG: PRC-barrel domain-containing protein [Gemmatimonadota bacterium]
MRDDMHDEVRDAGNDSGHHDAPLVHLADAGNLRVADGDPDIRGWHLHMADGEKVGTIRDLVVDTRRMTVRYVEARIDREALNSSDDRPVLIPIGCAKLDDGNDRVVLNPTIVDPRALPRYDRSIMSDPASGSAVSREHARLLHEIFPEARDVDQGRFFGDRRRGREATPYLDHQVR